MSLNTAGSDASKFRRLPVMRVFIQDLNGGQWLEEEKMVSTRYGRVKRVRICGTVIDRREAVQENSEESFLDESFNQNTRISFQVDDGTGRLWATMFGIAIEDYAAVQRGTLVDLVGLTRYYRNRISLTCEFVRPVSDPNWETFQMTKVLERRKTKPKFDIEVVESNIFDDFGGEMEMAGEGAAEGKTNFNFEELEADERKFDDSIEEIVDDSDADSGSNAFDSLNMMDQIVDFIQKEDNGDGVEVQKIAEALQLDITPLRKHLDQLCQDVKIYKASPGHYSAY